MKKQIILYIIQTIIPIETIFMLMVAFICQSAKDFSKYWLILLSFQIPIVCMVVFSTIAYYESYLNETEKWREQLKKMKQEWESNPEFIGCLIEVEKRNGTMKKYIRTENGVYELVDDRYIIKNNKLYEKEYFPFGDGSDEYIGEVLIGEILAEADTIEELCDEFVYINKIGCFDKSYVIHFDLPNRKFTEPTIKEKLDYIYKHYKEDLHKIKGAIYTDKGLIYVAKMNEKGELVLI